MAKAACLRQNRFSPASAAWDMRLTWHIKNTMMVLQYQLDLQRM
jgi:hypothetical protein